MIWRALLHHLGICRKKRLGYTHCRGRGQILRMHVVL
jgi:hypothetical protein